MKIAHISDIHVTSPYFVEEWGDKVVEFVNASNPDVLVITGDLTHDGYMHEYDAMKRYIDRFKIKDKVIVPGLDVLDPVPGV